MLGKLIKYDLKSLNRLLIILHVFLLITSVLIRIFLTGPLLSGFSEHTGVFFILVICFYILLAIGVTYGTYIIIASRFYKNLFSDEGYLTHTLPVSAGQHLLSKTIAGSIWAIIDIILLYASLYIVIAAPSLIHGYQSNQTEIRQQLGLVGKYADLSFTDIAMILLFFSILSVISTVIMIHASIILGQFFPSHPVIGSVVAYFALSMILSIISSVILGINGLLQLGYASSSETLNIDYILKTGQILAISSVICVISSILLYIFSYRFMKKRINLS